MADRPAAAVAVPVRDEAERLPALLHALARQDEAPQFSVCLFLDGCTDASLSTAEAIRPTLPYPLVISIGDARGGPNAGRARARAAALALDQRPEVAVLTTDADSRPEPNWIAANLRALDQAEVAAGRIRLDGPVCPTHARLATYYDRLHAWRRQLDPVEWEDGATHHWTSGASLAVRPVVYEEIGGFAPLPHGEDADFADRAWRGGWRVRRDARVSVWTSARRTGRAPGGFASALAQFEAGAIPRTTHPADETWRYRHHALARTAFAAGATDQLADPLCLDPEDLARVAAEVRNADAFAARVVGTPPGGMRLVSLDQAEAGLAALQIATLEGAA